MPDRPDDPMLPDDPTRATLTALAAAYRRGAVRPSDVTEACLARIEPGPVWRTATADRARAAARAADRAFAAGVDLGPLQGIPLAVKDLFDMAGEISAAGSAARLARGEVAAVDAPVVARLDAAGAVLLGRTHMPELAFSGLGLNPHVGTPDRVGGPGEVPGGSSSGSAVAVARGEAVAALGSDTGGSVRIPAAFQGLVGLKVTDGALPPEGIVPLSTTLDTTGPIARSVEDAWAMWRALAALPPAPMPDAPGALRLAAPPTVLREALDAPVAAAFDAALDAVRAAGHAVDEAPRPLLAELHALYPRYGSFAAHEAWAIHQALLEGGDPPVDRRIAARIRAAEGRPSSDYVRLHRTRDALRAELWADLQGVDAVLAPTVAVTPPARAPLEGDDDAYVAANGAVLRNTTLFNLAGGPAATLPLDPVAGIGLMVATAPGREGHALAVAAAARAALRSA
ncbi:MAG: amidase family protein [Trueperaceae bacterium]|nr:amidase family protein [Trueperaceae bacterium]